LLYKDHLLAYCGYLGPACSLDSNEFLSKSRWARSRSKNLKDGKVKVEALETVCSLSTAKIESDAKASNSLHQELRN
jgi:hypothetical protein